MSSASLLFRAAGDERVKLRESLLRSQTRSSRRFEKHGIARQEKSAFSRLGIEQRHEDGAGRLEHIARMGDTLSRGERAAQRAERQRAAYDDDGCRPEDRGSSAESPATGSGNSRSLDLPGRHRVVAISSRFVISSARRFASALSSFVSTMTVARRSGMRTKAERCPSGVP